MQASLLKTIRALQAKRANQKGFTLIELGIVIVILTVLAALAIPAIRTEIIKGRVSSTADDTVKAIVALKNIAGTAQTDTPFAGFTSGQVQSLFRNSNMKLAAAPGTAPAAGVTHSLGGANGAVSFLIVNTGPGAGSGLVLAINGINEAACANFATSLSKAADAVGISVNAAGTYAAPTFTAPAFAVNPVKNLGGVYDPSAASRACTAGDSNQINVLINAA